MATRDEFDDIFGTSPTMKPTEAPALVSAASDPLAGSGMVDPLAGNVCFLFIFLNLFKFFFRRGSQSGRSEDLNIALKGKRGEVKTFFGHVRQAGFPPHKFIKTAFPTLQIVPPG